MSDNIKLNESFAVHLIKQGILDEEDALQALDQQRQMTQPIGRIALDKQYLTMKQLFDTLSEQAGSQLRFGELAITLGYLDNNQLDDLLQTQKDERPGLCEVLYSLGMVKKGVLQKERRAFLKSLEAVLI
ncbi:MAG: hypothetical protein GY807_02665 [Gammaproteobacteria bacterium]|nr:hypothetical protein [Gammaproteobacteria bacterium]